MKVKFNLRFISIFLVLAMLTSAVPVAFAAETEMTVEQKTPLQEKYVEALALLKTLGVYTRDEAEGITADIGVTRGELVKRIVMAMNFGNSVGEASDTKIFMDIHDAKLESYVNLAYDIGIVKGTGDARFEPEEPATVQMAATMVMRALGYTFISNGYELYNKAANLGLLDNVESKDNITAPDLALLLYNALHTGSLRLSAFEVATQELIPDQDWLETWYNISYVEGIVEATEITALKQGAPVREGNIVVNGVEIFGVPDGSEELLGYPVRCYYDDMDGRNAYKYITSYGFDFREINLKATDVAEFSVSSSKFYDEKDKERSMTILSSADFVYNGKAESLAEHSLDEMMDGYTNVKLLDNNDDNRIDVVFIMKNLTFAVDSVDTVRMQLAGKSSELVTIQNNSDDVYSIVWDDGAPAVFGDIKEWNIVSITTSFDGDYVKIVVSDNLVTGTGENYQSGLPSYITIDGQKYEISDSLIENKEVQIGKIGTFYLSADGVIVAVGYGEDGAGKWVWAAGLATDDPFGGNYRFGCVEGSQADYKVYEVAERVVVDGKSVKEQNLGTELPKAVFPEAMIIWISEDGELVKVNTLAKGTNESEDANIYKRHKAPESAEILNDGKLWYNSNSKSFEGRYIIADDATNFAFPTYDTMAYDDAFSVKYAADMAPYAVSLYSLGNDTPVCNFSVALNLSKAGASPGASTGVVPFLYIGKEYDIETGDTYDMLYYLDTANAEQGVKIPEEVKNVEVVYSTKALDLDGDGTNDYTAKAKKPMSWVLSQLEKGDLVRIVTDQSGLAGVQHVFDISKRMLVQEQGIYCSVTDTAGWSSEIRLFAGKLYEVRDNYVRIITDEASYDPLTGVGMEVHALKANRSNGWNRLLTVHKNGDVSLSTVSATVALPGVKQNSDDFEMVMQSTYGDAIFKMFIDYTDSPY